MLQKSKGIFLLLLAMLFWLFAPAQQELRIRFMNQYEDPVTRFTLETATGTLNFKTDKEGYATIAIQPDEKVKLSASKYEPVSFSYNELPENKVLVVKKEFSWKDLLNPMYY